MRTLVTLSAIGVIAVLAFPAHAVAQTGSKCTPAPASPPRGAVAAAPQTITLEPDTDSAALTKKFGFKRGEKSWLVRINASPDLGDVQPSQIEIEASPLVRADKAEELEAPTFTSPRISNDRRRISFTLCSNTDGGLPGSYSGSVSIGGPPSVVATQVSVNVSLKERPALFAGVEVGVLIVALLALAVKGVSDYKQTYFDGPAADPGPGGAPEDKPKWDWKKALTFNWRTPSGAVTSVIAVGTALVAAYFLYHKSETWGADLAPDLVAVATSALTAVGIQGGISGVGSLIGGWRSTTPG